jgi:hypothetical protein
VMSNLFSCSGSFEKVFGGMRRVFDRVVDLSFFCIGGIHIKRSKEGAAGPFLWGFEGFESLCLFFLWGLNWSLGLFDSEMGSRECWWGLESVDFCSRGLWHIGFWGKRAL